MPDPSLIQQIKDLLAEAARAVAHFVSGLSDIRHQRQDLLRRALKEIDEKKIIALKDRIQSIKEE